ncbi:Cytokinin dehydrogenase [Quillaja saponaria]|uniref:cytokinin dehydrogenase n=1 Tax=Quillaja saponaria TaxID=32244 RepID=A0AAD7QD66_QUISA|nr:Cytokinin dehydrogenase [Quillaja saponaria]
MKNALLLTYGRLTMSVSLEFLSAYFGVIVGGAVSFMGSEEEICTCLVSFIITTIAVSVSVTESLPLPWQPPKEIANKLHQDPDTKTQASDDFGHIIHQTPLAVLYPDSIFDIASLINFSNSLPTPFTISSRGNGHSVRGQAMAHNGVVINMTQLAKNGTRIVVSQGKAPFYADVGAEQLWIDVLHATLEHGLAPRSWTDYLYLTVGGTLSNAGISGQTFKFGPQISNLNEIDVLTGKGEFFTCSTEKNSGLFYSALGGLGQFGIITRARILLQPAPNRVKWVHLFYNNFSTFSGDQERLITVEKNNGADYVEGQLLLNQLPLDLSFYPIKDRPRISSLVKKEGIIYIIELVKHYTDETKEAMEKVHISSIFQLKISVLKSNVIDQREIKFTEKSRDHVSCCIT